jgi:hypothetical protein
VPPHLAKVHFNIKVIYELDGILRLIGCEHKKEEQVKGKDHLFDLNAGLDEGVTMEKGNPSLRAGGMIRLDVLILKCCGNIQKVTYERG